MFVLQGYFEIGNYRFNAINNIEITRSIEELTSTAIIKMPSKFYIKEDGQLKYTEQVIKKYQPVKIVLGYKGKPEVVEFNGFVDKVKYSIPMEIHCEDAMQLLKRKDFIFNESKPNLRDILLQIVKDTPIKLAAKMSDMKLDKWVFKEGNAAQALAKLKQDLPMYHFYINQNGELYAGLKHLNKVLESVTYDLNYSLVENNLEFKDGSERKVRVIYKSTTKDNKPIKVEFGEQGGEKVEVNNATITNKEKLAELAQIHLKNLKADGFEGDLTSFLLPYAEPGMAAQLIDTKHPNREGRYLIKKVVTTYGTKGARRKVSLGNRLTIADKK
jgi:hypothetical protein